MLRELRSRLSDHAITDNHTSITLYQRIIITHPDDWVQQHNEMSVVKCKYYDRVPKHYNPWAFHCQDLISNIPYCLFLVINNQSCIIFSGEICRMRETVNPTEEVYVKKLWAFNTKQRDHELIRRNAACIKKKWEIPFLSFIAPPLKLHQIREHVKNTYLLKKLL